MADTLAGRASLRHHSCHSVQLLTCKGCGGKDDWSFLQHKHAADPCQDTKKDMHKRRPEAMKG